MYGFSSETLCEFRLDGHGLTLMESTLANNSSTENCLNENVLKLEFGS